MYLEVTTETTLRDIFIAFADTFEFLAIRFFPKNEMDKAKETPWDMTLNPLDYDQTLLSSSTENFKSDYEFLLEDGMRTGDIEEEFLASFGIYAQVCFIESGRIECTNAYTDEYTLEQFNFECSNRDCESMWNFIKQDKRIRAKSGAVKPFYPGLYGQISKKQ